MADSASRVQQAAALHRQAVAVAEAAAVALESEAPPAADPLEQHSLAEQLRIAAANLAPGWLGSPLEAQSANTPLGGVFPPQFVRLGVAQPLDDARFPAIVPLLGKGVLLQRIGGGQRLGLQRHGGGLGDGDGLPVQGSSLLDPRS